MLISPKARSRSFDRSSSTGGRGDLIVEVRLVMPAMLDERSKELMREFGRINGGDVRQGLWGGQA